MGQHERVHMLPARGGGRPVAPHGAGRPAPHSSSQWASVVRLRLSPCPATCLMYSQVWRPVCRGGQPVGAGKMQSGRPGRRAPACRARAAAAHLPPAPGRRILPPCSRCCNGACRFCVVAEALRRPSHNFVKVAALGPCSLPGPARCLQPRFKGPGTATHRVRRRRRGG